MFLIFKITVVIAKHLSLNQSPHSYYIDFSLKYPISNIFKNRLLNILIHIL